MPFTLKETDFKTERATLGFTYDIGEYRWMLVSTMVYVPIAPDYPLTHSFVVSRRHMPTGQHRHSLYRFASEDLDQFLTERQRVLDFSDQELDNLLMLKLL